MLNIKELEKRWLHYKIKSYIPHAVIIIALFIILSTIVIFLTSKEQHVNNINKTTSLTFPKKTVITEHNKTVVHATKEEERSKIVPPPNNTYTKQQILKPSMSFMNHIQDEESIPLQKKHKIATDLHKHQKIKKQKHVKKVIKRDKITTKTAIAKEKYLDLEPKEAPVVHKHAIITIERKESKKNIDDVIERFKNNHNPALSLFVAKKYYELGEYKQAYNYALITNGINNHIEASWLIFVKSLVKLHKKDMAIKTLIKYINYSHSENAKILLDNIESGKFR